MVPDVFKVSNNWYWAEKEAKYNKVPILAAIIQGPSQGDLRQ